MDIIIHSPGGSADAAFRLMKFLRRRFKKVNVLVPLLAKSAATLMCLGADRIELGELAELGPVDIQMRDPLLRGAEYFSPLDEFKSMEFMRDYAVGILDFFTGLFLERSGMSVKDAMHETIPCITGMMRPLFEQIDPLEMGEHKRAMAIGEEYAKRLLALTRNPNADKIVEQLVWNYPSHGFAIDFEEAEELNLPVVKMDREEEGKLLTILLELDKYEISLCGFSQGRPGKSSAGTRKKPAERKRDASVSIVRPRTSKGAAA